MVERRRRARPSDQAGFLKLWAEKRQLPVEHSSTDPLTALAGGDPVRPVPAQHVSRQRRAILRPTRWRWRSPRQRSTNGFDEELPPDERRFLYMPFEHSEKHRRPEPSRAAVHRARRRRAARICEEAPRHHRALRPLPAPQCDAWPSAAAGRDRGRRGGALVTDLVEAARFNSRVEADLARLYLESEGVDAVLFDTEHQLFLRRRWSCPCA